MPQGSVLGSLLFSLYTSPIAHIVSSFGLLQQQYADDTQIYVAVSCLNQPINIRQLEQCLSALHAYFNLNGLALNPSKSEVILMGTRQRAASLPPLSNINVAGSTVPFSSQVKLLSVTLDSSLSVNQHVAYISKSCFSHWRALLHIRHTLTDDAAKTIASSLVESRLDYANTVLVGTSSKNINRLQHIQKTLVRIVMKVPYDQIRNVSTKHLLSTLQPASNSFQNCCSNLQTIVDWSAILSGM